MLTILEYNDVGSTERGALALPLEPPLASQAIEVLPQSVQSRPIGAGTRIVKLSSDEDCLIDIGPDPDATNASRKVKAGVEQMIAVPMGGKIRIAVAAANAGSVTGMDSMESLLKVLASPAVAAEQFAAMRTNADKLNAASAAFKAASEENKAIADQLVDATKAALQVRAEGDAAMAELAEREARFDRDVKDYGLKMRSDDAAANARMAMMDEREVKLAADLKTLNVRLAELADRAAHMDACEKDLADREAALAAGQADYEARMAKLKAIAA